MRKIESTESCIEDQTVRLSTLDASLSTFERPPIVSRGAEKESPLWRIKRRMHIRTYRPDDLESLRRMTVEAFDGVSIAQNIEHRYGVIHGHDWRWHMARQIDADVAADPHGIFLAVATTRGAEEILGFVTTFVDVEAGVGYIPHLVVTAAARGQGLGRRLIEHALDYFRDRGLTHARIETLEQNAIGQHLFPACGFREVARKIYYALEL